MKQIIVVVIVVGAAFAYVIRNFYKKYQQSKSNQCHCGCSGCGEKPAQCSVKIE